MQFWGKYGDVYHQFIEKTLAGSDLISRGTKWRQFMANADFKSLKPSHAKALVELLDKYKAYCMDILLPEVSRRTIETMSANGEDVSDFEGVERVCIDSKVLKCLLKYDRLACFPSPVTCFGVGAFFCSPKNAFGFC